MSDQNEDKKPLQRAYSITEDKNGKEYWNSIGIATPHKDGQGSTVKLHSTPINGEIVLRNLRDKNMQHYQEQQAKMPKEELGKDIKQGYEPEQ